MNSPIGVACTPLAFVTMTPSSMKPLLRRRSAPALVSCTHFRCGRDVLQGELVGCGGRSFRRIAQRGRELAAPEAEHHLRTLEGAVQAFGDGLTLAFARVTEAAEETALVLAEHVDLDAVGVDGLDLVDEVGLEGEGDEDGQLVGHASISRRSVRASRVMSQWFRCPHG